MIDNSSLTKPEIVDSLAWEERALDLRRAGKSFAKIAAALKAEGGPGSKSQCYELVVRGLGRLREECKEAARDVRDMEVLRCDAMIDKLWERIDKEATEDRNVGRLIDSMLRVMDRKSRYLGLDAPKRIALEGNAPGGTPLLPPGSVVIQLVRPGEPIPAIPATIPAPAATEPPIDATEPDIPATPESGSTGSSGSSSPE